MGHKTANLGEERIQTVDLLSLLDVGIILGDATQSKLLHEVNLVRVLHVLVLRGASLE